MEAGDQCLVGNLVPRCVHMVVIFINQFGYGDNLVSFCYDSLNDGFQRRRRILSGKVHQYDGAAAQVLVVQNPVNYHIPALIPPIDGIHAPLNCIVAVSLHRVEGGVIVIPVGETEQAHVHAEQVSGLLVGLPELDIHLGGGELREGRVVYAVVPDLVAAGDDALRLLRVCAHPITGEEKGGFDIVLFQDIQDGGPVAPVCARIEGKRYPRFIGADTEDGLRFFSSVVAAGGVGDEAALRGL